MKTRKVRKRARLPRSTCRVDIPFHLIFVLPVRIAFLGLAVGITLTAFERQALAYTDPGTGALIWQMVAAGFVGAAFYFRRILNWFKRRRDGTKQAANEPQVQHQPVNADDRKS